ncbi:MAG: DUF397 domain-containing protein [Actinophytocola sp.]|uniref:DUF397 domain-containing protein n=1 Tax=Actinophytocola sp. TaxID=1872138 RepID=UPI003D6BA6A1
MLEPSNDLDTSARLTWRKSRFSGGPQTSCVEAAAGGGAVFVRDTKNRVGGTLDFRSANWATFITGLSTDQQSDCP